MKTESKKQILQALGIFFAVVLVDFCVKQWLNPLGYRKAGFTILFMPMNQLTPGVRSLIVSMLYGPCFLAYLMALMLLRSRSVKVKYSLSVIFGGMLGNVLDYMQFGRSTSAVPVFSTEQVSFTVNLANLFILGGLGWTFFLLLNPNQETYYKKAPRRQFVVDWKEQVRFSLTMTVICSLIVAFLGIFSWAYFKEAFRGYRNVDEYLMSYLLVYALISLIFLALVFVVGILLSNRISGPVFAFSKFVNDLEKGKEGNLVLRENDLLKPLEEIARKLNQYFKKGSAA